MRWSFLEPQRRRRLKRYGREYEEIPRGVRQGGVFAVVVFMSADVVPVLETGGRFWQSEKQQRETHPPVASGEGGRGYREGCRRSHARCCGSKEVAWVSCV